MTCTLDVAWILANHNLSSHLVEVRRVSPVCRACISFRALTSRQSFSTWVFRSASFSEDFLEWGGVGWIKQHMIKIKCKENKIRSSFEIQNVSPRWFWWNWARSTWKTMHGSKLFRKICKGWVGVMILRAASVSWDACLSLQPCPVGLTVHH